MKRLPLITLLLLVSLLLFAACQPAAVPQAPTPGLAPASETPAGQPALPPVTDVTDAPATEEELTATPWQWTGLTGTAPASQSVVPNPQNYTLTFADDGTLAITADCNQVAGTYTLDGESLTIELGPSTMAFCGEQSQDQLYLGLLSRVSGALVTETGDLRLVLADEVGQMQFTPYSTLGIGPQDISLDTEGLPYSWQPVVVPETPYDASMPPGPVGMPEHIEILFGVTDPANRQPSDPIMYIIPVNAYRAQWDAAGNPSVSKTIDAIEGYAFTMPSPAPTSGMPALPSSEFVGVNDLAVQVDRAVPANELNLTSSTQTGYRFVGRWAQDANPVTNQGLRYVYQGFTNDGQYLVSFVYPVSTGAVPADASQIAQEDWDAFNADPMGVISTTASSLNALAPSDWEPDLDTLDALVASLEIKGVPAAGLQDVVWLWTNGPEQPGSDSIVAIPNPEAYQVIYSSDGTVSFTADCNSGSMSYELRQAGMAGGMLAQPGPVTLAECGPRSYYQGFINALMAAQNYKVRAGGNTMELVLPAGGGSLIFVDQRAFATTPPPVEPEPTATRPPAATVIPIPPTNTPAPPTPTAEPTATPQPVMQFSANPTTVEAGQCTTLAWNVQNVQAVWVYPQGADYQDYPVTGQGVQVHCLDATTTYEMRVQLNDGTTQTQQVTVTVNPGNPLADTRWLLVSFEPGRVPLPNTTTTVAFGGSGELTGSGGCNTYSGGYSVNGTSLTVGPLASTEMACEPDVMDQEQLYLAALQSAASFDLPGGQLVLFDAAGQEILRYNGG
ncbi:MAG: META domain-containing protein [Caldilineales bacterium]